MIQQITCIEHIGVEIETITPLENVLTPLFVCKVSYHKLNQTKGVQRQVGLFSKNHILPSQLLGGELHAEKSSRIINMEDGHILSDKQGEPV